jgi:hypothetical protein
MKLAQEDLTKQVRSNFKSDFQRKVFNAAVKSFDQKRNPLRLNNFATALRELGRILLEELAPKESVRACAWFNQNTTLREEDGITRAQRVQYAVQGELPDDFVLGSLRIDVGATAKEYTSLLDDLSAYTHINEKTFGVSDDEAEAQAIRALETFDKLFELIKERHDSLHSAAADSAKDVLMDQLYSAVDDELDRLSTHTSIEDIYLNDFEILSIDPHSIGYEGNGSVHVRLQYGSDSDLANDDGVESSDSYPFKCSFLAETSKPLKISIVPGSLQLDVSSFYE